MCDSNCGLRLTATCTTCNMDNQKAFCELFLLQVVGLAEQPNSCTVLIVPPHQGARDALRNGNNIGATCKISMI